MKMGLLLALAVLVSTNVHAAKKAPVKNNIVCNLEILNSTEAPSITRGLGTVLEYKNIGKITLREGDIVGTYSFGGIVPASVEDTRTVVSLYKNISEKTRQEILAFNDEEIARVLIRSDYRVRTTVSESKELTIDITKQLNLINADDTINFVPNPKITTESTIKFDSKSFGTTIESLGLSVSCDSQKI